MNKDKLLGIGLISLIILILFASLGYATLTTNNIFYYSFDTAKISGTTIIDSGGHNNATNHGFTTGITGKLNQGINASTSNHYNITIDNNLDNYFDTGDNITICAWIKANDYNSEQAIFGTNNEGSILFRAYQYKLQMYVYGGTTLTTGAILANGKPYYVCYTNKFGTANAANLYVNGSLITTNTQNAPSGATTKQGVFCWYHSSGVFNFFGPYGDEIGMWNRSLSTAEILQLSAGINPYTTTPTIDYLNLSNNAKPLNNARTNAAIISFNTTYNASKTTNCNLYFNGAILDAQNGLSAGVNKFIGFNETFVGYEGSAPWFISCQSNITQENTTTRTIYIDQISPVLTISKPSNYSYWSSYVNYSLKATDTYLRSVYIKDSCGYTYTNTSVTSPFVFNLSKTFYTCGFGTRYTNISTCDDGGSKNLNCVNKTLVWYSRGLLQIRAREVGGGWINNFSIYVNGVLNGSTTNGLYQIQKLNNVNYTLTIDNTHYELKNTTVYMNTVFKQYNFSLYLTNSFSFTFKDEITKALITGKNIRLDLLSSIFSGNYSSNNTPYIYATLLYPTTYYGRYRAVSYQDRFYFFTLTNRTHTNQTLYMLSNTTGTNVLATVIDESGNKVTAAYIKVLKYDITTNNYLQVEVAQTNGDGQTYLHLQLNTEFYKFIIEYPLGTVVLTTTPTYIYSSTINFKIVIGEDYTEQFFNTLSVSHNLVFNDATNAFRFTYSDANNLLSRGCLYIYRMTSSTPYTLYNTSCLNSPSGVILLNVLNTTGTSYKATAYVDFGDGLVYMDQALKSFVSNVLNNKIGTFIIIALMLVFAFVAIFDKTVAIIITPLPMVIGSWLNFWNVPLWISFGIEIVCVIIAILLSNKEK